MVGAWLRKYKKKLYVGIVLVMTATLLDWTIQLVPVGGKDEEMILIEHSNLLNIFTLSQEERSRVLCEIHHSGILRSSDAISIVADIVSEDLGCSRLGYIPGTFYPDSLPRDLSVDEFNKLKECLGLRHAVAGSCRAYDKSGFYNRPKGQCKINLEAGSERFFAQNKVTVLSERYNRLSGKRARDAIVPRSTDNLIRSFGGKIRCTNKRGVGRTCRARATVQAISYPISCRDVMASLREIDDMKTEP